MNFNKHTIHMLKSLVANDEMSYFFDNIENEADNVPEELIGFLAEMLASELGVHSGEDLEKIKYFIRLGFFAHE